MLNHKEINNSAKFIGKIATPLKINHASGKGKFYECNLQVKRLSGTCDTIPLILTERTLNQLDYSLTVNMKVLVEGMVHTSNWWGEDGKRHLKVYVKVQSISQVKEEEPYKNEVFLCGYLCRAPVYRKIPLTGKIITDFMLAQNPNGGKRRAYIPCIAWNKIAIDVARREVSDEITIKGRFQSRVYSKYLEDGTMEQRINYEVSTMKLI